MIRENGIPISSFVFKEYSQPVLGVAGLSVLLFRFWRNLGADRAARIPLALPPLTRFGGRHFIADEYRA
jgi:hypothetical protein